MPVSEVTKQLNFSSVGASSTLRSSPVIRASCDCVRGCRAASSTLRRIRAESNISRAASVLGHIMIFNERHLDRVPSSYADYTISVNAHGAGSQLIGTASGAVQCPESRERARPSSEIAILFSFWLYLSEDFRCPLGTASIHSDCRIFHSFP